MAADINALFNQLKDDPWRAEVGFSPDVAAANEALFAAADDAAATATLRDWLANHQPCIFGRIAAKTDLISFCTLRESDLCGDRTALREKIQDARSEWLALGHEGKKSAFVILAISPRLTIATPDDTVRAIAQELCASYLIEEAIVPDEIYLDAMYLEKPGTLRTTWRWLAGINYFSAQGDKRWWHDHRIPGGMAFSVNSAGHLVKSGQLSAALKQLDEVLKGPPQSEENEVVATLGDALDLAMRTIGKAADAVSGKATELLPLPSPMPEDMPTCPKKLPKLVADKDYTKYKGWYHTDITIPSEYFRPDVERPQDVQSKVLDFTYLFHDDIDNPDHLTTAKGRRVRSSADQQANPRLARMVAESVAIRDQPTLVRALAKRGV